MGLNLWIRVWRLLPSNHNNLFPDIKATEQPHESSRTVLKTFDDVFFICHFPFPYVRQHEFQKLGVLIIVIKDHKSLDPDTAVYSSHEILNSIGTVKVVLGDHSTQGDPATSSHVQEHCIEHLPSDIVEVDVNSLWEASVTSSEYMELASDVKEDNILPIYVQDSHLWTY